MKLFQNAATLDKESARLKKQGHYYLGKVEQILGEPEGGPREGQEVAAGEGEGRAEGGPSGDPLGNTPPRCQGQGGGR